MVPRWVQAIVVAVALFALTGLARAAAPVLMVFLIAVVVAPIVNPLVTALQRARVPRGIAIGAVFVAFFLVMAGVVVLVVRQVAAQLSALQADLPRLVDSANASLARFQQWLDQRGIGVEIKRPGETALETLQASLLRGTGNVVAFTSDLVTMIAGAAFVLILVLVITIYMLIYGGRIGSPARQVLPPGDGSIEDDYRPGCSARCRVTCAVSSCSASSWDSKPEPPCGCLVHSGSSPPVGPTPSSSVSSTG
ncbi:uncharacterized protein DUF20 [Kribbella sp. VKM Ac-2527]|uniref:Uncharacterized protein DUF20 n=1 Tax=Kribbella caucasensis TaxID=2512215 RepID=A0A4R6KK93_9ACTN|nr:uncharacterized protein DUF20 [Kribbella sp. VKM Ac-2527]